MKEILVWYEYKDTTIYSSCHLTVQNDSIAYTIAEYESRNPDIVITHYMNENNNIIDVPRL